MVMKIFGVLTYELSGENDGWACEPYMNWSLSWFWAQLLV